MRVEPGEALDDGVENGAIALVAQTGEQPQKPPHVGHPGFYEHPLVTDETQALLAEIEQELTTEGQGLGDWIGCFAAPVALMIGKKNCMSCEVRKAALNATAKLSEKYGKKKAKKMIKKLIKRSFKEKPDLAKARAWAATGDHFWNSGVFVWT